MDEDEDGFENTLKNSREDDDDEAEAEQFKAARKLGRRRRQAPPQVGLGRREVESG